MWPTDTRILIVDDMPSIRELVQNQLKALGFYNFYSAENGEDGFKLLESQLEFREPIGLVISDWYMPIMSGYDFLRKVRSSADFKNLAFVMLTAEAEKNQVVDAIQEGASQYLLKPFTAKRIEEKLKMVWKKQSG